MLEPLITVSHPGEWSTMEYEEARDAAYGELQSPLVPAERLSELAYAFPDLRDVIAIHPNAYEELRAWIADEGATIDVSLPSVGADIGNYPESFVSYTEESFPTAIEDIPPPLTYTSPIDSVVASDSARESTVMKVKAFVMGMLAGVILGGAVATVLVIWVLPGLFGSFLG